MVTLSMTDQAREDLSDLPRLIAQRVEKLLTRLSRWPDVSGVKHLLGDLAGKCRLRTGDYRLQFHIEEKKKVNQEKKGTKGNGATAKQGIMDYIVVVEKIGHGDGFYEE